MRAAGLATLSIALAASVAHAPRAWAQRGQRIVVEQFAGPDADKFRRLVVRALGKARLDLVPDGAVATAEADLGLLQSSDNYPAVAKSLKAAAFVGGSVTGTRKLSARLRLRDSEGKNQGDATWSGATSAKLFSAIEADLTGRLGVLLEGAGLGATAGGDGSGGAVSSDEGEAPSGKRKRKAADGDGQEQGDESGTVSERAEAGAASSAMSFDVMLGLHLFRRAFRYVDNTPVGDQKNYTLPLAPAPSLAVEFFPVPYLGVALAGEYVLGVSSKDKATGTKYTTKALAFTAGVKGRLTLGAIQLDGLVAYGQQTFRVDVGTDPMAPQIAGVAYSHIRAGGAARVPLGDSFALLGGAAYLHLLSAGRGAGDLFSDEYFKYASGRGGEGTAGVAIALPWRDGLEARVLVDYRRYVFSMNSRWKFADPDPRSRDPRVAGGATDDYVGLNLAVAYRP